MSNLKRYGGDNMLNVRELKAAIVRKGLTQEQLAKKIGISSKTFGIRLKKGVFGSDEIEKMISILEISEPMHIFFDRIVSFKDTEANETKSA